MYCGYYNITTQPENHALAERLRAVGGGASFDVDDVLAVGPPAEVYPALRDYGTAIAALGEELRPDKGLSYSAGHGAMLSEVEGFDDEFPVALDEHGNPGMLICGIPVGTDQYVQNSLATKAVQVVERSKKSSKMLQLAHLQTLHLCATMSFTHVMDYWLQHCYPVT